MGDERLIQLGNGGQIAFEEYGDPTGTPVVFCHGWPTSRTMAQLTDDAARQLCVRIISPDRPGISGSSFQPNRKLLEWPPIVEGLVDHLGVTKFRMLAISGGAPYAYVTARAMPKRVRAIAIVSGAPPIADLADHSGLLRLYRWMLKFRRTSPQLLRILFHIAQPVAARRIPIQLRPLILKFLHPYDAAVLRDNAAFEACFESARRAWRGSVEGIMIDAEVYGDPWGFSLEDIDVPARVWHGKLDRALSLRVATQGEKRLRHGNAAY